MAHRDLTDKELSAKYDAEILKLFRKMNYSQQLKAFDYIKALFDKQNNDDKKTLN